ncbi:CDGSH iron-sulfur domain-containing protein [Streptomyces kronopolitis]|uniref:CDGSH iron-sulfur domain-containing protein n=1 Tax=Streptomyces kronopolitis TaxID=1612435 RepID=UPI0036A3FDFB
MGEDGAVSVSRRFTVAICRCRRSRRYPWCDTSHRPRAKPASEPAESTGSPAAARAAEGDQQ